MLWQAVAVAAALRQTARSSSSRRRGASGGRLQSGYASEREMQRWLQEPEAPPEEKRVRNGLIKAELGVRLQYPSYREGLAAIAAGDLRPFE